MKKKSVLVICDFDGTVSPRDIGFEVLQKFTGRGWEEIDRAYCSGEIGSKEAYLRIAAIIRGSKDEILRYVDHNGALDSHFQSFHAFCLKEKMGIAIVSDGLDFYIDRILKKHDLGDIRFYSNVARFNDGKGFTIEFPEENPDCNRCGTCKSMIMQRFRERFERVIYIGDGYSDVCPAEKADLVFAKGILLERFQRKGLSCIPYEDFGDIRERFERDGFLSSL